MSALLKSPGEYSKIKHKLVKQIPNYLPP